MMHEGVFRHRGTVAGADGAAAVIVVFEAAHAKLLVKQADLFDDLPADEHAEADDPLLGHAFSVVQSAVVPGEPVEVAQVRIAHRYFLCSADAIRAGADDSAPRLALQGPQEPVQPTGGHNHVVIEQQDLLAARGANALVAGRRVTSIVAVLNQTDVAQRAEVLDRAVRRAVVHHDDLVRLIGSKSNTFEA